MRRTKIVCTLGPASLKPEIIASLIRAGMNVARLNTSHGTIQEHVDSIELVRKVAAEVGQPVGVLMDLAGPKMRTGPVAGEGPIPLEAGQRVRLTSTLVASTSAVISVEYPQLVQDVAPGEHVLLDDGNIELLVLGTAGDGLDCTVITGGPLGARRGVSFPHSNLSMPALTDRDREAIKAGVGAGVDLFALSFVQDASDLIMTRECITSLGADTP
ncbi:MAG TPA: pyruvate kinase, partial [Tepidiformaceae bacterium]